MGNKYPNARDFWKTFHSNYHSGDIHGHDGRTMMMVMAYDWGIGCGNGDSGGADDGGGGGCIVMLMGVMVIELTGDCGNDGNIDGIVVGVIWPLLEHLGL